MKCLDPRPRRHLRQLNATLSSRENLDEPSFGRDRVAIGIFYINSQNIVGIY